MPFPSNSDENLDTLFRQAESSLHTLRDFLRFAVSRFQQAGLVFGHGSDNAHDRLSDPAHAAFAAGYAGTVFGRGVAGR